MTPRQQLAYDNPLFSIFQLTGNNLWREETDLPTGIRLQTWFTVNAYEEPFAWHAAAGFVRRVFANPKQDWEAIPYKEWDKMQQLLAAQACRDLLVGVGRTDGGEHWDSCHSYELCIQANRRMSEEEAAPIMRRRLFEAPLLALYPSKWEKLLRTFDIRSIRNGNA
jgi:hypothetical protein